MFQAHIRLHIDTLLGSQDDNTKLPVAASDVERAAWNKAIDLDALEHGEPSSVPNMCANDDSTPFEDGPSHPSATPQQLTIMRQMMGAV